MGVMNHQALDDLDAEHESVGNYDGGRCLSGHMSAYTPKDSCSYRWQGIEQAKTKAKTPSPYSKYIAEYGTGFGALSDNAKNIRVVSLAFAQRLATAEVGETLGKAWVTKRSKKKDPKSKSKSIAFKPHGFVTGWSPWKNQVHHVLPTGVLISGVVDFSKPTPHFAPLIFIGLLDATYNQNYMTNMIILPVLPATARIVGLPTHTDNHTKYSEKVSVDVTKAINNTCGEAKSQVLEDLKNHKIPDLSKLKKILMAISRRYYKITMDHGDSLRGSTKPDTAMKLNAMAAIL